MKRDKFSLKHLKAVLYLLYFESYALLLTGIALLRSMVMYLSNSGTREDLLYCKRIKMYRAADCYKYIPTTLRGCSIILLITFHISLFKEVRAFFQFSAHP